MSKEKQQLGNEAIYDAKALGWPKMLILGIQHLFAMFGATVLVPILGVSQILCKHRRAVKNRAKNIYWGGGLSATPWIQYRQRIACMSRAAAGKPLFTLPLICMQLSVNQAFCPQNKRPSERGSCSSPVACPSIFL